jgi:phosphotransferase family enzyme
MSTDQQQLVDQDCYRVALVLSRSQMVLAEHHGQALGLPRIRIARWTRRAEQLTEACYARWHVRSLVVDFLAKGIQALPCVVIEVLTRDWDSSVHGFRPVRVDEVDERELTEPERATLHSILAGDSLNRGPFSRVGWIEEAKTWIQASVPDRILEFSEDVRAFNAQGTFALVRFETAQGPAYWLKATGAPNAHEFTVTKTLARYLPSYLPPLVATREDWNAWVMEDSGRPLSDTASLRSFEQAISSLAGLQKASVPHLEELMACGCLDQRMPILRAHLSEMTRYLAEIMRKQTSTKVPPLPSERLHELGNLLDDACAVVQSAGFPDTLIHNDMTGNNVLFDGTRAVFTDWAEASIGNPFFTFHHLRAQALSEDPTWVPGLTAAYKQHWRPVLSDFQIECALALTQPLAIVSYLYGRDPSFTSEYRHDARHQSYARSLARHMDRLVQDQEFRRALCN